MNISATELPNFIRKYYLLHELLIFKNWRQNISVSNIALHTAVRHSGTQASGSETVHLLTHETPDFITPALWPANSPDLTPSTTWFGEAAGACVPQPDLWRRPAEVVPDRRVGTFPPGGHRWSGQVHSSDHVFELAFEHTVDILNMDFRCADVLPFARTHTWQSITPVPIVDTYAFEWPY